MKQVKIKLHELMGKHKIRSINKLSIETGITRQTLTRMYNEESTQLDFATIGKLCDFFECEVGELLTLVEIPEDSESE